MGRLAEGRITWTWPVLIVFARFVFAVLAYALVVGLFALQGNPEPRLAAAPWWVVYGTLIDIGCLLLLAWLARREGIRLLDLVSFERHRLGRDLLHAAGLFVLVPTVGFAATFLFTPLIYGTSQAPLPFGSLPLWGALYSVLVWPVIWGIAEEMTYQGYALPRLEVLSKRAWLAVLIVSFGFAVQHVVLPLGDAKWMLLRFATTLPIGVLLAILYLRTRRLLPFIIGHVLFNAISPLMIMVAMAQ